MKDSSATPTSNSDFTYIDCYGWQRNRDQETAEFHPHKRDDHDVLMATDALTIAELPNPLPYPIFNLPVDKKGLKDDNGNPIPWKLIITTPNMLWLPDVSADPLNVCVRSDGRFYSADFTLWPQWFFPGTYYYPYVPRKPSPKELETHQYKFAWYDMKPADFMPEKGSISDDIGRLRPDLAEACFQMRQELCQKIKDLKAKADVHPNLFREIFHCERGMVLSSVTLKCAPQTYAHTLINLTTFQRYFLETLACYNYLSDYRFREVDPDKPAPVNSSIMGAVTPDVELAQEFLQRGVPVWLVRPPSRVIRSATTVISPSVAVGPNLMGLVSTIEPWAAVIHNGPPSATRNRACQSLRSYSIKLGHAAYYQPDNEMVPERMPQNAPPAVAFFPSQAVASPSPVAAAMDDGKPNRRAKTQHFNKAKVPNNVNRDKFSVPKSKWEPPVISAWRAALASVDSAESHILQHPDRNLLRGYLFPDPYLLTKNEDSNGGRRASLYLIAWLAIRAKYIEWLVDNQDDVKKYPRPQEWRDTLADVAGKMGLMALLSQASRGALPAAPSLQGSSRNTSSQPQAKRRKLTNDYKPPVDCSRVKGPIDISWNGEDVVSAALLRREIYVVPDNIAREIVWDLYEHNFRLELLALDRCVVPRRNLSELDGLDRDDRVRRCFPNETPVNVDFPTEDRGLGAEHWGHRMQWVEAFRSLISGWPNCPEELKKAAAVKYFTLGHIVSDEGTIARIENVAYPFYCQTFFNYFGRAPSIPHCLPCRDFSA